MSKDYVKFIKPNGKAASKELLKNLRDRRIEPIPEEIEKIIKKYRDPSYYDSMIKISKTKKYKSRDLEKINNRDIILSSSISKKDIILPRQEFSLRVVRTPIILITNDFKWLIYGRNTLYYNEKILKNREIIVTEINAKKLFGFIRTKTIK